MRGSLVSIPVGKCEGDCLAILLLFMPMDSWIGAEGAVRRAIGQLDHLLVITFEG